MKKKQLIEFIRLVAFFVLKEQKILDLDVKY